jgi:uncharacterized protein (UPF0303 family)
MKSEKSLGEALWNQINAVEFGEFMKARGLNQNLKIVIAIFYNGQRMYHVGLPGTELLNDDWVMRKVNTVELTKQSSLSLRVKVDALGVQEDELGFQSGHLAVCGGGYPLYTNGELVGIAVVSGLPHVEDHEFIVKALEEFRDEQSW